MSSALAQACWIFFLVLAPALLAMRYGRPRILPRWGVLIGAAVLGGAAFYLREKFALADMMESLPRYMALESSLPILGEGMVRLQRPNKSDFMLGAVIQLVYLLLWLVPYGILRVVESRRTKAPPTVA